MYTFSFDYHGTLETWRYDEGQNRLSMPDGTLFTPKPIPGRYGVLGENNVDASSIWITLGLGCVYRCAYCAQGDIKSLADTASFDAAAFARNLRRYYETRCTRKRVIKFSLWGGEPLLYMDRFRALHDALREEFRDYECFFCTCSNGSLLKGENARWLLDNRVGVTVSYDGPGQFVRSRKEDILGKGTETREAFLEGMRRWGGSWNIAAVMHRHNPSLRRFVYDVSEKLGTADWILGDAVELRIGDEASCALAYTEEQAEKEVLDRQVLLMEEAWRPVLSRFYVFKRLYRFSAWLNTTKPVTDCLLADNDYCLRLDLQGNLWTCHNNLGRRKSDGGENLYGGSIVTGEHRVIDVDALHEEGMERCEGCLLRWFCGEGCKLLPLKYRQENCRMLRVMYWPLFTRVLYDMTGRRLTGAERMPHAL